MNIEHAIDALRAAAEMAEQNGGTLGDWVAPAISRLIVEALRPSVDAEAEAKRARNAQRMRDVRERAAHVQRTCNARATHVQRTTPTPSLPPSSPDPSPSPASPVPPTPPYNPNTPSPSPAPSNHQPNPAPVVVVAHAREVPAENPTTTTTTPPSTPILQAPPETVPEAPQPLPPPSARPPRESPPRSAPPPPPAGPAPGHLRQPPRGPAWDPSLVSAEDGDRLREASLKRLLDPAAWFVSIAAYLRDKGEPHALARWESLVHSDRIAEAVAALEITAERPRGVWDAYTKQLLLVAMTGGRSLAQERAAPARASPAQEAENLTPGQRFRRYIEKIGHPAAFGAGPPPAPDEGPIIDVEAG